MVASVQTKLSFRLFLSMMLVGSCHAIQTQSDAWEPLRELLAGWEFTTEYAVSVGNKDGPLFVYESGNFTMHTQIMTGSTSKWPSAMMFAGLVSDGTISSLEEPISTYVPWWTKDPSDMRSLVTLRMLLSFTSGFGDGNPGQEGNTRAARAWRAANNASVASSLYATLAKIDTMAVDPCNITTGENVACAKSIYDTVKLVGKPGGTYSYNSNHLQIAAAVAMLASGLPIHQLVQKYLLDPYNMTESFYDGQCPDFGFSLMTTGSDYQKFLQGVLGYSYLKKEVIDASEEDNTPFLSQEYTLYGGIYDS